LFVCLPLSRQFESTFFCRRPNCRKITISSTLLDPNLTPRHPTGVRCQPQVLGDSQVAIG
jgi:hypothetical protein